jgi:Mrp family chromosome partitioning ATPase
MLGRDSEDLIYEQISEISSQLVPLETRKLSLQARLEAMTSSNASGSTLEEATSSQLIQDLKSQASAAEQQLKSIGSSLGKSHPDVIAAQKRAAQARADIAREIANIKSSVEIELEAARKQEILLRERLDELNKQAGTLKSSAVKLESLEAEETANRVLLENLLQRHEEIRSQMEFLRPDVRVVSLANVPTKPEGVGKLFLFVLLSILSVGFGIAAIILMEMIDRGIERSEDVKKILNIRLLGTLPYTSNPIAENASGSRNEYHEEIRRIYLMLATKKESQSVLFTSASKGEGKTVTALSLARYMHSIGVKTILVDAHARQPALATLSGISPAPGFADYVRGAATLENIKQKSSDGLPCISYGDMKHIDLLSSDAPVRLIAALKSQYDFVLIDGPSAIEGTDAEILAAIVDQAVLVAAWSKTTKKELRKAVELLRQHTKYPPVAILNKKR